MFLNGFELFFKFLNCCCFRLCLVDFGFDVVTLIRVALVKLLGIVDLKKGIEETAFVQSLKARWFSYIEHVVVYFRCYNLIGALIGFQFTTLI